MALSNINSNYAALNQFAKQHIVKQQEKRKQRVNDQILNTANDYRYKFPVKKYDRKLAAIRAFTTHWLDKTNYQANKDIINLSITCQELMRSASSQLKKTDKTRWLIKSASLGHHKLAEQLVIFGANINACLAKNKMTPLHFAAQNGHLKTAKLLIKSRANVTAENENKMTPLHFAAQNGHLKTAELLIKNKASVLATDNNNNTPLFHADSNNHNLIINLLNEHGAQNITGIGDGWVSKSVVQQEPYFSCTIM